jgi:hypothetical protein
MVALALPGAIRGRGLVRRAWNFIQTGREHADLGVVERYPATKRLPACGAWLQVMSMRVFGTTICRPCAVSRASACSAAGGLRHRPALRRAGAGPAARRSPRSQAFFYSAHLARTDIYVAASPSALALLMGDDPPRAARFCGRSLRAWRSSSIRCGAADWRGLCWPGALGRLCRAGPTSGASRWAARLPCAYAAAHVLPNPQTHITPKPGSATAIARRC